MSTAAERSRYLAGTLKLSEKASSEVSQTLKSFRDIRKTMYEVRLRSIYFSLKSDSTWSLPKDTENKNIPRTLVKTENHLRIFSVGCEDWKNFLLKHRHLLDGGIG